MKWEQMTANNQDGELPDEAQMALRRRFDKRAASDGETAIAALRNQVLQLKRERRDSQGDRHRLSSLTETIVDKARDLQRMETKRRSITKHQTKRRRDKKQYQAAGHQQRMASLEDENKLLIRQMAESYHRIGDLKKEVNRLQRVSGEVGRHQLAFQGNVRCFKKKTTDTGEFMFTNICETDTSIEYELHIH